MDKHLKYALNYGMLDFSNEKEMWIVSTTYKQTVDLVCFQPLKIFLIFLIYRSLENSTCLKEVHVSLCSELVGDFLTAINPQSTTLFGLFVHFMIMCHVESSSVTKTDETPKDFFLSIFL